MDDDRVELFNLSRWGSSGLGVARSDIEMKRILRRHGANRCGCGRLQRRIGDMRELLID